MRLIRFKLGTKDAHSSDMNLDAAKTVTTARQGDMTSSVPPGFSSNNKAARSGADHKRKADVPISARQGVARQPDQHDWVRRAGPFTTGIVVPQDLFIKYDLRRGQGISAARGAPAA